MPSIKGLQEQISLLFYYHGLLCASHPFAIISLVITIVMFLCYPLVHMPLPGNAPLEYATPVINYSMPIPRVQTVETETDVHETDVHETDVKRPRWVSNCDAGWMGIVFAQYIFQYFGPPVAYIQQVVVKAAVYPWQSDKLIPSDSYRASLSTVFDLLEHIDNYQQRNGTRTQSLSDLCLRVAEVVLDRKSPSTADGLLSLLPEYNCLQLSPARLWSLDKQRFMADGEILNTVFKKQETSTSITDILFGVPWKNSGLKKYYLRNKQRVVSYAITIVYRKYDYSFVTGLREHLMELYPLSAASPPNANRSVPHLVHIHYQSHNYIVEYTPLLLAYVILCLYLYFSVRKIEMVKSKWGLAFSAMITVFASLSVSVSLCVYFGLTPNLSGSEIFPYLVVVIGLENVLVVTKSVVSTPVHLDVKLRVAQGLQKEGWYIFKHLMTELLILAFGFLTFVPAIQEFCFFALFGLGSDVFLQMFFFTTVLSIDIRRMELSDLQRPDVREAMLRDNQELRTSPYATSTSVLQPGILSKSHCPVVGRLSSQDALLTNGFLATSPGFQQVVPGVRNNVYSQIDDVFALDADEDDIIPTKLRLEWAQYRVVQRFIMFCVIVWITLIVYKTGLVEDSDEVNGMLRYNESESSRAVSADWSKDFSQSSRDRKEDGLGVGGLAGLLPRDTFELWKSLSPNHWRTLFGYYNMSLRGRYLTILPSIHLSIVLSPEESVAMRHPAEVQAAVPFLQPGFWQDGILDSVVLSEDDAKPEDVAAGEEAATSLNKSSPLDMVFQRLMRYPKTRLEFVLTIILGIASVILWLYLMLNLYKCMCSRNYARWRSSWFGKKRVRRHGYYAAFRESVPLVLSGHRQEVECIVCDGQLVVSSCLGGEIRVWDLASAECRMIIDRTLKTEVVSSRHRCSSDAISTDSEGAATPYSIDLRHSAFSGHSPSLSSSLTFEVCQHSPSSALGSSLETRFSGGEQPQRSSIGSFFQASSLSASHRAGHSRHRSVDFALASIVPNLADTIDTDFSNTARAKSSATLEVSKEHTTNNSMAAIDLAKSVSTPGNGFDFTHFQPYFDEHRKLCEEQMNSLRRRGMASSPGTSLWPNSGMDDSGLQMEGLGALHRSSSDYRRQRSISFGDAGAGAISRSDSNVVPPAFATTAIWSLGCHDNVVVAGCGNGSIEFWDVATGQLKYRYHQHKAGVIAIGFHSYRIVVARVNGIIDFLRWESSTRPPLPSRLHCSADMVGEGNENWTSADPPLVILMWSVRAHQHPINAMRQHGDRIVTGSSDHTLKVYRVDDALCLYTLHGHTGGVSTLCLEWLGPMLVAASGSEDASVRLWDIQTGTCLHKLTGHDAMLVSVAIAAETRRVVSVATDDRLCIWDSTNGNMLHCLQLEPGYCNAVAMLTKQLIVTGGQGFLHLWDVATGLLVRAISLSNFDSSVFVRQLHTTADNSVLVCDYGSQLRLIRFASVLEKDD